MTEYSSNQPIRKEWTEKELACFQLPTSVLYWQPKLDELVKTSVF